MSSITTPATSAGFRPRSSKSIRRSPSWSLFWKESRQLAPLFGALLLITVVLHTLGAINGVFSKGSFVSVHQAAFVLMPALFGIGAGAVLVSQEKEQRTLLWLTSLPIPSHYTVYLKLLAGVGGLSLFWLVTGLIGFLFCPDLINPHATGSGGLILGSYSAARYVISSYFLLIASMVCGWVFESTWLALGMVVPIAIVVFVVDYSLSELVANRMSVWNAADGYSFLVSLVVMAVGAAVLGGLGYRYGRRSFVTPSGSLVAGVDLDVASTTIRSRDVSNWKPQAQFTSLLWQIGYQNQMLWISGIALVALVTLTFVFMVSVGTNHQQDPLPLGLSILVGGAIISWLGASTFASDSAKSRIRFLADRGVSPGIVWRSRLLWPFAVLSLTGIVASLALLYYCKAFRIESYMPLLLGGWFCLASLLVFATTQWSSLWLRSPLVNTCLAPGLAAAILFYATFILNAFESQPIYLLGTILVMFVASRVMMRAWMDGRYDLWVGLQHCGFGVLALMVPLIPYFTVAATYPAISRTHDRQLMALSGGGSLKYSDSNTIMLRTIGVFQAEEENRNIGWGLGEVEPASDKKEEKTVDPAKHVRDLMEGLEYQIERYPHREPDWATVRFLTAEGLLASKALENGEPDEEAIARYRRIVRLRHRFVESDRTSGDLWRQEYADQAERWLVGELSKPKAKEVLGQADFDEIATKLADRTRRNDARRRAIAVAWADYKKVKPNKDLDKLGTIGLPMQKQGALMPHFLVLGRRAGLAAESLLEFLDSGNRQAGNKAYKKYAEFWNTKNSVMTEGAVFGNGMYTPGTQWHRDWETQAMQLVGNP